MDHILINAPVFGSTTHRAQLQRIGQLKYVTPAQKRRIFLSDLELCHTLRTVYIVVSKCAKIKIMEHL
jgi:hypothetical protein